MVTNGPWGSAGRIRARRGLLLLFAAAASPAGAQVIGPSPYLTEAHSPFRLLSRFTLETFEDGLLNTPGVTAFPGEVIGPGGTTDSVDADDGRIDGFGTNGRSFFSAEGNDGITVRFSPQVLGFAPTHAGVVWTDGFGAVTFRAFDTNGVPIGQRTATHADNLVTGQTGEDRFYGVAHGAGIGSIRIRNVSGGIEIDHIQFAYAPCYVDCDTSTGIGVIDVFDFLCFLNRYDAGDPYACDCDVFSGPGVCDIFDFLCFQNAFDIGCP